MDWKTKSPATETEKTYPQSTVLGEKAKGVRWFFNLTKGKSMRQLNQSTDTQPPPGILAPWMVNQWPQSAVNLG